MTEEEYDMEHHKQISAVKNFEKVHFGFWLIKTWYFFFRISLVPRRFTYFVRYYSPYPLTELEEMEERALNAQAAAAPPPLTPAGSFKVPLHRHSRAHGRTVDLFAGGLQRHRASGPQPTLWVCERCFSYMSDSLSWEMHQVNLFGPLVVSWDSQPLQKECQMKKPPGRLVYNFRNHSIWEVDAVTSKVC
jgi:hypothetical protein